MLDPKSASNSRRLGRAVGQDEMLTNPLTGKLIVLDEVANNARLAFESEMKSLLHERNTVRAAMGLEPVKFRQFYTPPPSTRGKRVGFTLDQNNRVVPGGAIVADSDAEFEAARKALVLGDGHRFMTQEEIQRFSDLWEQAQIDFIDPTLMAAPARAQSGGLSRQSINPNAIEDVIQYLKHGYENTANGSVRTVFDAQLKIAKARSSAAVQSGLTKSGVVNIWDQYTDTLLGVPGGRRDHGLNHVATKMEELADRLIAGIWGSGASGVSRAHMQDILDKVPEMDLKGAPKGMSELMTQMGDYTPFARVMDYVQYSDSIKRPPELRDMARGMNRVASGLILRWLEMPHAIMNMAGIVSAMPGILGARNVPILGKVGGVGVVDTTKIMSRGFARMLRERSSADWGYMVRNGDTSQDVAELHKQLSLMKGKNGFMRMMTGDPKVDYELFPKGSPERAAAFLKHKGIEGMASIIADTSENMSRRWAHFVGLELADLHGITGMEARHTFARQIANDTIANYDPLNRPEIFQSAFGSMYGLFLSYGQNYYQRLFRWMEDGDYQAMGKSFAMQASMFGMFGLPGSRNVAELFAGEDDGTDVTSQIYSRFGAGVGSAVAQGGLNQITTIFGLPPVALHTRGDSNFRHPSMDFLTSGKLAFPPGLEVMADLTQGIIGTVANVFQGNPRGAAETLARFMPSRTIKGLITVAGASGQDVDGYGNVMSEVQGDAETWFRMAGLRSARQQIEIEAYFRNSKANAIDSQRMSELRIATKSLIRGGNFDGLPAQFEKYVNAGGQPANYSNWIQTLIEEANNTRTENQLLKALRSPSQQQLATRIQTMTGM